MPKHIYVVGAVIIEDNKILCAQRGAEKSLPLLWEFPGGKIEAGETPREALEREIYEEMKCEINIGEKIADAIYEYEFGTVHLTTFVCKLVKGDPVLTEHKTIKWLMPQELSSLEWAPADLPTIDALQQPK